MGSGVVGCVVMPWSIFPDVTDVGELRFGYRNAGSFSGVLTFSRKFSGAIGIFAVGMILEFSGYLPPIKSMEEGRYVETEVRHGGGRYWDMGRTAVIHVDGSSLDEPNLLLLTTERSTLANASLSFLRR